MFSLTWIPPPRPDLFVFELSVVVFVVFRSCAGFLYGLPLAAGSSRVCQALEGRQSTGLLLTYFLKSVFSAFSIFALF